MKRTLLPLVALAAIACSLLLFIPSCTSSVKSSSNIPNHPIPQGVSAPFAGFVEGRMLIGGGCNFPDVPAADGGKKVYYASVYACEANGDAMAWKEVAQFPQAVAYGASVETDKGLVCIGGMNESGALREVYRVEYPSEGGKAMVRALPSLPETIDNAAATRVGDILYVTGGNQEKDEQSLYALTMDQDTAWTHMGAYPGAKRIQPVLAGVGGKLYLFGGFAVDAATKEATISSDYIVYDLAQHAWSSPQPLPTLSDGSPRAMVGSAGVVVNGKIYLAGGVNYSLFKAAVEGKAPADYMKRPSEWYRFSKDISILDPKTQAWEVESGVEGFNKAGGILLYQQGTLYMVCGEIKPGIRTSEIVAHPLQP